MANLIVRERKDKSFLHLPHMIYLNNIPLGIMGRVGKDALNPKLKKAPLEATILLNPGHYTLCVRSMFKWFYSTIELDVSEDKTSVIEFDHKEFWWDMLFLGDIVICIALQFIELASPWETVYDVVSNGVFLVWLIHEIRIRKKYFKFYQL